MAIPRVDISQEIADWQAAVYGEEVRSANVSALTKLQTQMNAACDGIEDAEADVATAVNTANAASTTANAASSAAQTAISTANAAITTAQGYAANAEGSAQAAAASATAAQTAQTNAQTAQLAAEAAEQAAEAAAQQAQIAINITPDEETIHHASDTVGTISAITYTLEEIAAMTDPSGKIPDASAVESLRESLTPIDYTSQVTQTVGQVSGFYCIKIGRLVILNSVSDSVVWTANKELMRLPSACYPITGGLYTYGHQNGGNPDYGMAVNIRGDGQVLVHPENTTVAFRCCFTVAFVAAS